MGHSCMKWLAENNSNCIHLQNLDQLIYFLMLFSAGLLRLFNLLGFLLIRNFWDQNRTTFVIVIEAFVCYILGWNLSRFIG
jgi:hypothetical protein